MSRKLSVGLVNDGDYAFIKKEHNGAQLYKRAGMREEAEYYRRLEESESRAMNQPKDIMIDGVTLEERLDRHELWLNSNKYEGEELVLKDKKLPYTNFTGRNFADALILNCDFTNSKFKDANFKSSTISKCSFHKCDLRETNFSHASIDETNFTEVFGFKTNFENSYIKRSYFNWAKLEGGNFKKALLSTVIFEHATLKKCDFANVTMSEVNFKQAHLNCCAMPIPTHGAIYDENQIRQQLYSLLYNIKNSKPSNEINEKIFTQEFISLANDWNELEHNDFRKL